MLPITELCGFQEFPIKTSCDIYDQLPDFLFQSETFKDFSCSENFGFFKNAIVLCDCSFVLILGVGYGGCIRLSTADNYDLNRALGRV